MAILQQQFTNANYIEAIEDSFLQSVARQLIGVSADGDDDVNQTNSAMKQAEDLEIAVRRKALEILLLQESDKNGSKDQRAVADEIGLFWKSTLELCQHFLHFAVSSSLSTEVSTNYENLLTCRRLPFLLLSDCIEGLPSLEDANYFWSTYVEPELVDDVLFGDIFWSQMTESNNSKKLSSPSSHLPFLKVANQFLKRLDDAPDNGTRVEWKGRIMWALSKGFSIADKSALKAWGNFHHTNGTDFESKEDFNVQSAVGVDVSKSSIEYSLYEAFWSLQNDFANPNKINVGDFIKRLRLILAAMESVTATENSTATSEGGGENMSIDKQATKYLTSSALLPSQIQDPIFRSSVVTQFLIVASHLGAESPPLKNALASLLERARKLLKNDNPQLHSILWESILANGREDHWRTWKKQKCATNSFAPNIKRNKQLVLDSNSATNDNHDCMENEKKKRRLAKDAEDCNTDENIVSSLSRNVLDNDDLIAVSKDRHTKLPTLDEHLEPYVEALDPESGIEDEYHPKNDSLFTWRAMRLYTKHQLPLMSQCRQPADLEKITREWYRQSHGTSIPGEMQILEELNASDNIEKNENGGSSGDQFEENDDRNKKSEVSNPDVDMKDSEKQDNAPSQDSDANNADNNVHTNDIDKEKADVVMEDASSSDAKNQPDGGQSTTDTQSTNVKQIDSGSTKEGSNKTELNDDSKAKESKIDTKEQGSKAKNIEVSKSNSTAGTKADVGKNNEERNLTGGEKGKSESQRQEKRTPRENTTTQNRASGRRGNDGGRNNPERRRRDDAPPPRRRNDDVHQSRGGGRSTSDSSYRGRSDEPPSRGGRYEDDYRGDTRGDRFAGERSNRPTGRENNRAGDRDDHRGGERGGDRMRRNMDNRSRGGGGGGRRRR